MELLATILIWAMIRNSEKQRARERELLREMTRLENQFKFSVPLYVDYQFEPIAYMAL